MAVIFAEKLEHYLIHNNHSIWNQALKEVFSEKKLSQTIITDLIANAFSSAPESSLSSFRIVLAISFYLRECESEFSDLTHQLKAHYFEILDKADCFNDKLCSLYHHALGFFLFNRSDKISPDLLHQGFFFAEEGRPHPLKNVEASLILLLYGYYAQDEFCIQKGWEYIQNQQLFFDQEGEFFAFFIEKETRASAQSSLFLSHLAFWIFSQKGYSLSIKPLSTLFLQQSYDYEKIQNDCPLFLLFYPVLIKLLSCSLPHSELPSCTLSLKELGIEYYQKNAIKLALSCYGIGSGLGSVKKKNIQILSMGPQLESADNIEYFGLYRAPFLKTPCFKEIKIEKELDFFIFDGWTRLIEPSEGGKKPSKTWLHAQALAHDGNIELNLNWLNFYSSPQVFFLFFVKAAKLVIEESYHLHPHTLHRYQGKNGRLSFIQGEEKISIHPQFSASMQAIPLSGETHFWGADFLVAFELPKDSVASFKIF